MFRTGCGWGTTVGYANPSYLRYTDPPINTTRFNFRKVAASRSIAAPKFVSGPMAISVISPGCSRIAASKKSTARPGALRPALRILRLGKIERPLCRILLDSHGNGNIGMPRFLQEALGQPSPQRRIPPRRCDSQNLQLRTLQCELDRKRIIDMVPNVRIDNHQLRIAAARCSRVGLLCARWIYPSQ